MIFGRAGGEASRDFLLLNISSQSCQLEKKDRYPSKIRI